MADEKNDPHLDALAGEMAKLQPEIVQQILATLKGPAPTAPTPPQFTGLPPLKAAAAAMNPQFAPLLIQNQMQPAQAQYQAQQAAFEQAMLGRREALQSGTQLAGLGIRSQADMAEALLRSQDRATADQRQREQMDETARHNKAMENKGPSFRSRLVYDRAGNAFEQDLNTGQVKAIPLPTGGQAGRPFTAGEVETSAVSNVLDEQLGMFEKGGVSFADKSRAKIAGSARAAGQTIVRSLPGGQVVSEMYGDPDFEALASLRDRIGQQLARLVDSGRLSDQDREFALSNLPNVASLTTEEGRKSFAAKIALVRSEMKARMEARERLRPGITPTQRQAVSVDDILRQIDEERNANPAP